MISQLVCQESQPFIQILSATALHRRVALVGEFGDGTRYPIVQAAIERFELFHLYRCVAFHGQTGYLLAKISIVANDVFDRKASQHQLTTVPCRGRAHLSARLAQAECQGIPAVWHGFGRLPLRLEHVDQLLKENRHPVLQTNAGRPRRMPLSNPRRAASKQVSPVRREKFM
jgi:hypothetical protein